MLPEIVKNHLELAAMMNEMSKPIDLNKNIPQVSKGILMPVNKYNKRNKRRRIANKSKQKNRK